MYRIMTDFEKYSKLMKYLIWIHKDHLNSTTTNVDCTRIKSRSKFRSCSLQFHFLFIKGTSISFGFKKKIYSSSSAANKKLNAANNNNGNQDDQQTATIISNHNVIKADQKQLIITGDDDNGNSNNPGN